MDSKNFVFWLQGLFELSDTKTLDEKQTQTIKNHLKLVFLYDIDPSYSEDPTVQQIFQNIHDGKKPLEGVNAALKQLVTPIPSKTSQIRC